MKQETRQASKMERRGIYYARPETQRKWLLQLLLRQKLQGATPGVLLSEVCRNAHPRQQVRVLQWALPLEANEMNANRFRQTKLDKHGEHFFEHTDQEDILLWRQW